jgi:hypothetical protein
MPATAPWWGVPVIAGGFLLIGAVLGFLFTSVADWRKHRREDRVQYRNLVLEVVIEVINALNFMDGTTVFQPDSQLDKTKKLEALSARLEAATARIEILKLMLNVSDLYYRAHHALHANYSRAVRAYDEYLDDEVERDALYKEASNSSGSFLKSARRVLGIR